MKKKIICLLLVLLILIPTLVFAASGDVVMQGDSGSDVYAIQRRLCELGYLNYRPTGKFSDMTANAVRKFQQLNGISADGQVGQSTRQALFSDEAIRNTSNPAFKKVVGKAYNGSIKDKGLLSSWEEISHKFTVGSTARLTDYNTGKTYDVKRVGGVGCAQVVPVTEDDFDNYTTTFGGLTWEHRAVLVDIGGTQYAGSIFGMPTQTGAASASGMTGYTILYFNNSKTDVASLSDEEHLLAITGIAG